MHDWDDISQDNKVIVWAVIVRILRNREDAADCFQDVFCEAYQRSLRRPVENLPGLLQWLAVKRSIDVLRKRTRSVKLTSNEALSQLVDAARENGDRCDELLEAVRNELAGLPNLQAEAFWLCCVEDCSYAAVAETLGITVKHVGTLVYRARKHLRQKLDPSCHRISY